jgi:hypothetical protein
MAEPIFTVPTDPSATVMRTEVRIWEKQVDEHVKRGTMLAENLKTDYSLIYGQCSDAMRAKLESRENHLVIKAASDSIGLLENIRTVMFQFQSQRYAPLALHEAKYRFYLFLQDRQAMCQQYHKTFKNNIDVIEYCGGVVSNDTGLVDNKLASSGLTRARATPGELEATQDAAREWVLACAFLVGSNRARYGKLLKDLENDHTQGTDNYPATLQQTYTLLVH